MREALVGRGGGISTARVFYGGFGSSCVGFKVSTRLISFGRLTSGDWVQSASEGYLRSLQKHLRFACLSLSETNTAHASSDYYLVQLIVLVQKPL